jgi:hypothetical protein
VRQIAPLSFATNEIVAEMTIAAATRKNSVGKPKPHRATAHQPIAAATIRRAVPPRNGQSTRPPPVRREIEQHRRPDRSIDRCDDPQIEGANANHALVVAEKIKPQRRDKSDNDEAEGARSINS